MTRVLSVPPPTTSVAVTGFSLVGVEPALGSAWENHFATRLAATGLQVTSSRDLQQLLGLERQKQLLGCAEEASSCTAELSGALGVDALVTGNITHSGTGFIATVRVLATKDGKALWTGSERLKDENGLLDWLDGAASAIRSKLGFEGNAPVTPVAVVSASGGSGNAVRWVPGIIGGAVLIGGGICLGLTAVQFERLRNGDFTAQPRDIAATAALGRTLEPLGYALAGVGVAGVVTSIVWASMGAAPPTVTVGPTLSGPGLVFSGSWP